MELMFTPGSIHPTPEEVSASLERAAGVPPTTSTKEFGRTQTPKAKYQQKQQQIVCAAVQGLRSATPKPQTVARIDCYYDVLGATRAKVASVFTKATLWRLSGSWYRESSSSTTCTSPTGTQGCLWAHTALNATGYFQGQGNHTVTPFPEYTGTRFAEAWSEVCYIESGQIKNCF
jgi:hypothetical protein